MDNTFSDIRNVYLAYSKKIGDRMAMYREVIKTFSVESILYPGSHIDLAPSFLVHRVIYVDKFKGAKAFFKNIDDIKAFVEEHKEYNKKVDIGSFIC